MLLSGCAQPAANDNTSFEWVTDEAEILSDSAEARIAGNLITLEDQTSDQVLVWTTPSLGSRPIEDVSLERARSIGAGTAELDNGVLITVAPNDRKVRIEVGTGLEDLLTDVRAKRIIDEHMSPKFARGDFDAGVEAGVEAVSELLLSDRERPKYRDVRVERMAS
nr:TPM domain-containing protein [Sphingomicrobium sp. B8]